MFTITAIALFALLLFVGRGRLFTALKNLPRAVARSPYRVALFGVATLLILGGGLLWSDFETVLLGAGAALGTSASTKTTFAAFLKELYDGDEPENLAKKDHPFFTMVPKKGGWTGDVWKVPVTYGNPTGRSRTFSTAQSRAAAGLRVAFKLDITKDYGVITMDALAMAQSKGNAGAFAEMKKEEYDGIIAELGNSISRSLYRAKGGAIGKVKTIAGAVVTLTNKSDTRHFQKGMVIVADTVNGGGSVEAGSVTVLSVQRQAGTVTFTGNYTAGIATGAVNDFLFCDGDYGLSISGMESWIPLTAPSGGDNHFGVDRSVDPEMLAGWRINNPSRPIHENLMELGELIGTVPGGKASHAFINHLKWTQLSYEQGDKVVRDPGTEATVGFPSFKIMTSGGSFNVFADPDCPEDLGYVTTLKSLCLRHLYALPHVVDDDGNVELRQAADDGVEARARAWCNLATGAPARHGVCAL